MAHHVPSALGFCLADGTRFSRLMLFYQESTRGRWCQACFHPVSHPLLYLGGPCCEEKCNDGASNDVSKMKMSRGAAATTLLSRPLFKTSFPKFI